MIDNTYKHQINLWQIMYEQDEDGCPLLDWLEDWDDEKIIENIVEEEKLYNDAGFQVESCNLF